jgi:CDC45-like protein
MQYNSIPVFSNLHLIEELKKLSGNPHVRSLIFLNCGGLLDLTSLWFYKESLNVQSFIFDSHRPFHHANIIDPLRKVYIMHDGCKSFDKYPTYEDFQLLEELAGDEDSDEEDEFDDDSEREEAKEELEDLMDNGSD